MLPPIFAPDVLTARAGLSPGELVPLPPVTADGVDVVWTPEHRGRELDPATGLWIGDARWRAKITLPFPLLTEAQAGTLAAALWGGADGSGAAPPCYVEPYPLGPGSDPGVWSTFVARVLVQDWSETRDRILRRRLATVVAVTADLYASPYGHVVTEDPPA